MSLKEQFQRLKENWLLALIVLILLVIPLFPGEQIISLDKGRYLSAPEVALIEGPPSRGGIYYDYDNSFAPEIEERKITKNAQLSLEIERGQFFNVEKKLKDIISASNSFLLNENINKYDSGWKTTYQGYYQIKVEASKYEAVLEQLKALGEIELFSENTLDITGRYTNLQEELELEKERLARYQAMYQEVKEISDKIELSDRIFNQERRIRYLEEALKNKDLQVEYSTINLHLQEKHSEYADITISKFSQLIRRLVNSFNSLLSLIFWAIPWLVALALIWLGVRFVKKRK